jgi:5-formyltetrahydrofolate cyclo-ligase
VDPAPETGKRALRRRLLHRRSTLPVDALAAGGRRLAAAAVPALEGARAVAAYASIGTEPATGPLLAALDAAGVRVLLPVLDPGGDLDWAEWAGALEPGPRGTRQPVGPRLGRSALAGCDAVVVPALAVDRRGVRLGRGGGAYDRALPRARGVVVALLHDGELVEALPEQPHDVRVAAAVTPSGGWVGLPQAMGHDRRS